MKYFFFLKFNKNLKKKLIIKKIKKNKKINYKIKI